MGPGVRRMVRIVTCPPESTPNATVSVPVDPSVTPPDDPSPTASPLPSFFAGGSESSSTGKGPDIPDESTRWEGLRPFVVDAEERHLPDPGSVDVDGPTREQARRALMRQIRREGPVMLTAAVAAAVLVRGGSTTRRHGARNWVAFLITGSSC